MAAPIPNNFGGDRQFIADPEDAGLLTAIGDLTALLLRNLHLQREGADAATTARSNADPEIARRVLDTSIACQARESSVREPLSVTRVPDEPYGDNENIAYVRMSNIPIFTGEKTDSVNIVEWISRILNLAESMKLTFNATVNLLILSSDEGAVNFINEMKQEHKSLQEIIQYLEMRYLPNLDIKNECSSLIRKRNENIFEFYDRLRLTARVECKDEPDDALRKVSVENLITENIHRVLTPLVKNSLEERKMNRSLFGLPPLNSRELVAECYFLEKSLSLRKYIA